ncbi:AfsR/SARP family transcriptional regulator [Amycolatopsis mediterranei]|uniref:AfsR/SARP family transcriptional regulator n=1 Tax=Amycolatopsis mediterranei TaxID=33910 RepID=UPI00038DCE5A|nr:BTAD domain-containing putative transcriptional regulator [Amycolatopsis mediterranei]AGT85412.1 SARP family transcriptional regulator [Amycolatopsis mediterranei RB]
MTTTETADATLRILGPIEVEGPTGAVHVPPGRQQAVLAFLLMEANQVVSIDSLVDALWEENPPDTARTQVQICVSRLRRNLTDGGVGVTIETRPPGYRLRVEPRRIDAQVFTGLVARARTLIKEGRAAQAAATLRAAVALWRGPCLSGLSSPTLRTRALRLDEDHLTATEDYLELELGLGKHRQVVGETARLVREHPLRERLRALLMVALYRSGRQAEALETYRVGRDLLIDELGLEPGPDLRGLEAAILAGAPELRYHPPEPEGDTPEPATPRVRVPRQLPAATADFVGHDDVLAEATGILTRGPDSTALGVLVVVGRPGVGKSTVAALLGHRLGEQHFPDGQLYCDLRGTRAEPSGAAEVIGRFLVALGIPGPMLPEGLAGRADMYRTLLADRRVLVVLDDAVSEQQVLPLLPGNPRCAVLVTSRSRLAGVPGARRVELDVLRPEESLELIGRVIGHDRTDRERKAAGALVRTVGGLPLALRIIAARLAARPHWTLASMVQRLASERHRLDELAHGEMTIRASLSLTHDGLDPRSRRLFGLLSLPEAPSLSGWVAGAALDDDRRHPSDLLEPLVDVQMLDVAGMGPGGEFAYRYQDMVRLFAREKLAEVEANGRAAALDRVLGGWLALAEDAHRRIYGGDYTVVHGRAPRWRPDPDHVEQLLADPLGWLADEQENLCAAVLQAAAAGLDELAWDLAVTSATLFEARGLLDDWERTHTAALTATRAAGNTRGTAVLLSSLGTQHLTTGRAARAHELLTEALALFVELGEPVGLGLCRRDLALLARRTGDEDLAMELYSRSLRDFDRAGDVVGRATVLTQRAHVLARRHRIEAAQGDLAEALGIYRELKYAGGITHAMRRVGQVQSRAGEHDAAVGTLSEVLAMVRDSRDVIGEGHLLHNLGEVCAAAGRLDAARGYFEQALAVRETIMDHQGMAAVRADLAVVLGRLGRPVGTGPLPGEAVTGFAELAVAETDSGAGR